MALRWFAALVLVAVAVAAVPEGDKFRYVTCGSVVKLKHEATGYRLHSHEVSYGSGSGQQSVTAFPGADDPNSYWMVQGSLKKPCRKGDLMLDGDIVRFEHLATGAHLHSHLHQSPLSKQQEVSCFGKHGAAGDSGDEWRLICEENEHWGRDERVRLQHVDTSKYLHSHNKAYGNPIPGQLEVTAVPRSNANTMWIAEEGVYFAAATK